jgi:hypothetical protein
MGWIGKLFRKKSTPGMKLAEPVEQVGSEPTLPVWPLEIFQRHGLLNGP